MGVLGRLDWGARGGVGGCATTPPTSPTPGAIIYKVPPNPSPSPPPPIHPPQGPIHILLVNDLVTHWIINIIHTSMCKTSYAFSLIFSIVVQKLSFPRTLRIYSETIICLFKMVLFTTNVQYWAGKPPGSFRFVFCVWVSLKIIKSYSYIYIYIYLIYCNFQARIVCSLLF